MTPDRSPGVFRCFVAVPIPDAAKSYLERFTREAAGDLAGYRFGASHNLHITLQFLGNVPRTVIPDLCGALGRAARGCRPFPTGMGEAGSFPARGRPRILYVDLGRGEKEVSLLASGVGKELSALGYRPDRPFAAHITLGRAKDLPQMGPDGRPNGTEQDKELWGQAFCRFKDSMGDPPIWETRDLLLMESILDKRGPTYIRRSVHPLGT